MEIENVQTSNVSEARGLVVDMLANRDLPPNVVSCLRAVATLLNPHTVSTVSFPPQQEACSSRCFSHSRSTRSTTSGFHASSRIPTAASS
ncbi:hypothetical protein ANCDUO_17843 [Ancylostoma duodenale]|uniref:Uncharacterized protein n=1 Tax=Ancylostoma duodenale TaxID=51022 RepID=A0A0C2FZF8_9BILA|nr:hypothetical protein ANCDUO_17843 [Ancylostoma duodenale]